MKLVRAREVWLGTSHFTSSLIDPDLKECHGLPLIPQKTRNEWGTCTCVWIEFVLHLANWTVRT